MKFTKIFSLIMIVLAIFLIGTSFSVANDSPTEICGNDMTVHEEIGNDDHANPIHNEESANKKTNTLKANSENVKTSSDETFISNKKFNRWIKTYDNTVIDKCNLTNITNFGNLTIKNSNFKKVNSDLIIIYNKGNLSLINVTIENCSAPKYIIYGANITNVINCSFNNNRLTNYLNTSSIMLLHNSIIQNTLFKNNSGGIKAANVTINNCSFIGNHKNNTAFADHNGGAAIVFGNSKISNSKFENNTINTTGSKMGVGGAIYNTGNLTSTNNIFKTNNASKGGALFNKGMLNSTNDTYTRNFATYYDIIFNQRICNITNSIFDEGYGDSRKNLTSDVGKIFNSGNCIIKNSTMTYLENYDYINYAISQSKVVINNTGTLSLIHNRIMTFTGSIYSTGNLIMKTNSISTANTKNNFINNFKSLVFNNNKLVSSNTKTDTLYNEYAIIMNQPNSVAEIQNNNFSDNRNTLLYNNCSKLINYKNNTQINTNGLCGDTFLPSIIKNYKSVMNFENNILKLFESMTGLGKYIRNIINNTKGDINIKNNVFENMELRTKQGYIITTSTYPSRYHEYSTVIYDYEGNLRLSNNSFNNLTSGNVGGVLILNKSNAVITGNNFTDTRAINVVVERNDNFIYYSFGGVIYARNSSVIIENNSFINSSAVYGDMICNINSNLTINNNTFKSNTTGFYAVIYNKGNCNITNNQFWCPKNNDTIIYNTPCYPGTATGIIDVTNNTFSTDKTHSIKNKEGIVTSTNNKYNVY